MEAGLVGARHYARLFAIDADEIFGAITKVAANKILTGGVVLARVRIAFVDVFIAPVSTEQNELFVFEIETN